MSVEALSAVGEVAGAIASPIEAVGSVASSMPSLAEPLGSLGSVATESMPIPTDISVFERAFAEPIIETSPLEITNEAFRDAIKGIDVSEPDLSIYEKAFEPINPISAQNDVSSVTVEPISEPQILEKPTILDSFEDMEVVWSDEDLILKSEAFLKNAEIPELDLPEPQTEFVASMLNKAEPAIQPNLLKDAELAGKVEMLLEEVGFTQNEATTMATKGFEEAIAKKGVELQPENKIQPQFLTEEATELEEEVEILETTDKKTQIKLESEETVVFVRDENANSARKKDAHQAIDSVFSEDDEQKDGTEVTTNMNASPSPDQTSEIVRKLALNSDGSYYEALRDIQTKRFSSKNEAEKTVNSIIDSKPAVKVQKSGQTVSEKDVLRVLQSRTNLARQLERIT